MKHPDKAIGWSRSNRQRDTMFIVAGIAAITALVSIASYLKSPADFPITRTVDPKGRSGLPRESEQPRSTASYELHQFELNNSLLTPAQERASAERAMRAAQDAAEQAALAARNVKPNATDWITP